MIRGFTLEDLGRKVDLTFQQIQKYESGINAVSIEKLCAIAEALSVDVTVLLPDKPTALHEESNIEDGECDSEILNLVREYKEIKNEESRKAVRELIRSLTSTKN